MSGQSYPHPGVAAVRELPCHDSGIPHIGRSVAHRACLSPARAGSIRDSWPLLRRWTRAATTQSAFRSSVRPYGFLVRLGAGRCAAVWSLSGRQCIEPSGQAFLSASGFTDSRRVLARFTPCANRPETLRGRRAGFLFVLTCPSLLQPCLHVCHLPSDGPR